MRRMILPLMLFVVAAFQPATAQLTDAEKAAIRDEVSAHQAEFWNAWRDADWDRGMSYYHDSPDLAFAMEGVVDYGYAEIDAKYRPNFANVASQTLAVTDSRTTVLASDVVCIMETATMSMTDTAGVSGPEMDAALTNIWVLRDGEWKIHISHESLPTPAAESR